MMSMERRAATTAEARALAHPLRLRILRLCLNEALTNKEIADRLGQDPGTTHHHVRRLLATGFLAAGPVRHGVSGALEKPYRATGKSWVVEVVDPGARSDLNLATLDALRAEIGERPDAVVFMTRMGLRLTPADAAELEGRLDGLAEEFMRRDRPGGEPVALFAVLHRRAGPGPMAAGPAAPSQAEGSAGPAGQLDAVADLVAAIHLDDPAQPDEGGDGLVDPLP
jgi:DNA-binding transcriptional ArsR family regulator